MTTLLHLVAGPAQEAAGGATQDQITIGEIRFQGNRVFKDTELLSVLEWVRIGAPYQPKKAEHDLQANLLSFYRDRGYIQARIEPPTAQIVQKSQSGRGGTRNHYRVTIPIEEGRQYRYRSFELTGVTVFKPQTVNAIYPIQPGDVVNLGALLKANDDLQRLYFGWAYLDMQITPKVDHDEQAALIDLKVDVQEGRQYKVSGVEFKLDGKSTHNPEEGPDPDRRISGQAQEADAAGLSPEIEKAWLLKDNEAFNIELLELSLERLNQIGQFEEVGRADCKLLKDSQSAEVKIVVELKTRAASQP